jgi:hypothetical protein
LQLRLPYSIRNSKIHFGQNSWDRSEFISVEWPRTQLFS